MLKVTQQFSGRTKSRTKDTECQGCAYYLTLPVTLPLVRGQKTLQPPQRNSPDLSKNTRAWPGRRQYTGVPGRWKWDDLP